MYWEAFLRVGGGLDDEAPAVDEGWAQARGIGTLSAPVIRLLRREVLPRVRGLEARQGIFWFSFLIHDRDSGVPTTEDDRDAYVHLRFLTSRSQEDLVASLPGWQWVRPIGEELPAEIAGVDANALKIGLAWGLLGLQSTWVLAFLEDHVTADDTTVIRHLRQFLHFFANMVQMKVA